MNAFSRSAIAALAFLATGLATTAEATVVITTMPLPVVISPGIRNFATSGADMKGLSVTVAFDGGADSTFTWAATSPSSGGVITPLWSLTVNGDTSTAPWLFSFAMPNTLRLTHLALNGATGFVVFDRDFGNDEGTPGSAAGRDFTFAPGPCVFCIALVNYSGQTAIGGAPPVGDVWQAIDVTFTAGTEPRSDFAFFQDSDNDIRALVPEPETYVLTLFGLGLAAAVVRRRRAAQS